ncbi:MAG: glycosyltransferase family 4 protein, partial [Candidatus Bathyarchaeia archaeon]
LENTIAGKKNHSASEEMRVVHIAPFYHPVVGGVEDVIKHIAEYMANRGHEVYVVTYNRLRRSGFGSLPREEVINGVRIIRLRPSITWSHGTYSSKLPEVIKALKPDIVHVHVWRHPHVFQVSRLKEAMGFKAVLHGHAPFHKLNQLGVITWIYHKLVDALGRDYLKAYDVYISLTKHEASIITKLGISNEGIEIIPNGIEEDVCNIGGNAKADDQVLYLGRISRSKNISLLLRALRHVVKEVKSVRLVLAGPDEGLINGLLDYASRHNINVHYLGEVNEKSKHILYIESTLYALPSLYEPFGITLLEAETHGTPPVITGSGGQVEVAPPGLVSLWAKPMPEKYGEAIITLLVNESLRKRLGLQAREWAQQYLWSRILPRYEKLYRELGF